MVSRGLPVAQRWARIGPRDPSWLIHIPQAGLCLSAFVVIRKGNKILLGRPHAHNAWPENGGFPKRHAGEIERKGSWLLPATHLLMEEKPDHAAKRIANQVGQSKRHAQVRNGSVSSSPIKAIEVSNETGETAEALGYMLHL